MKLSNNFWRRLYDNLFAIILLLGMHVIMTLTFPGHAFLGRTANEIARYVYGIIGMSSIAWLFTMCNNLENAMLFSDRSLLYEEPIKSFMKWLRLTIFILVFGFTTYSSYRSGWFNYSKIYYFMLYANGIVLYYFIHRAAQKRIMLNS